MSEESYQPDKTPGIFAWNELMTRDPAACVEFYTKLFGWSVMEMPMPGGGVYTMFSQGNRPVAGCAALPPEAADAPPMWVSYINVANLDASVEKAKELGGHICKGRVDTPMGSFAIVTDPNGATFAFWQPVEECQE